MGLRARLALFFVAITVVPMTVAVIALQLQIDRQLQARAEAELVSVREALTAVLESVRARTADLATALARRDVGPVLASGDPERAQRWLEDALEGELGDRADFVLIGGPNGELLASLRAAPRFAVPDAAATQPQAILNTVSQRRVPPGTLLEVREVQGDAQTGRLGLLVAGLWTDVELLERLPVSAGAAVISNNRVLAAVGAPPEQVPAVGLPEPGAVAEATVAGAPILLTALAVEETGEDDIVLVWARRSAGPSALATALLLLLPSVLVAGALGWVLAGGVIAPIRRAADVARAVAGGDLDQALEPTGGRELEDLAAALNLMSNELAARLDELSASRDQLRHSLQRLGQTLSSSLDLNTILAVVVETAMSALGADRGVLHLFTPQRDELYVKVGRGLGTTPPPRVRVGEGVVGHVAQTATPVRLPVDADQVPPPLEEEPQGAQQLTVPMLGRGQVLGVLTLLRDDLVATFTEEDLDTIRTFAAQASTAIENVMLHEEAQRLSVTDALTGLWNFRYFQMQADRELESASRFERHLSLVIVDLDHFKDVNDRYGHQAGDEVLIEVARRISECTRVPDVVARYGGEEFVLLLPGTDLDGALATAERVRTAIAATPIVVRTGAAEDSDLSLDVTCSAGAATFPTHARTVARLLRSADAAMYTAKARGRNRVVGAGSAEILAMDGELSVEEEEAAP